VRPAYRAGVLVVTRHRLPLPAGPDIAAALEAGREVLAALATRPGWRRGWIGRAADDPALLIVVHEWEDAGSCRRAMSAHEIRATVWPFLQTAVDEPAAFEVLHHRDGQAVTDAASALADPTSV
jgi:hypothetical protein